MHLQNKMVHFFLQKEVITHESGKGQILWLTSKLSSVYKTPIFTLEKLNAYFNLSFFVKLVYYY